MGVGNTTTVGTHGIFVDDGVEVYPPESDVTIGVQYGPTGTEFTGSKTDNTIVTPAGGMIIPEIVVRKFLQVQSAVTDLTEERIYETLLPFKKFVNVQTIPQTILIQWGGGVVQRGTPLIYPELVFRCYGPDLAEAKELYQALCSVLHEKENLSVEPSPNKIVEVHCSVPGHPQLDEQTDWWFIRATFSLIMTNQI